MQTYHSLQLHCYDNVCHCDWRLTSYGCVESNAVRIINIINIALSAIIVVIGASFLFIRLYLKGQTLMDTGPKPGILKPNPINCIAFFLTLFSIIRLVNSAILVADFAPNNMVFRSFFYEFGWETGFWACAAYIIGMAQSTVESQRSVSEKWLPSARTVDIAGFIFLLGPFVTNSSVSLAAGILAAANNPAANLCTSLIYVFWIFHCGFLGVSIIYFGIRLIQTLSSHLTKFNVTAERFGEIKAGIFKIRCIIMLISSIVFSFGLVGLLYGILRELIIKNHIVSITLCAFFNLSSSIATLAGIVTYFFTPVEKVSPNGYDTGQSSTVFDSQDGTRVISGMNKTFKDTMTHGALNDLEEMHHVVDGKWNTEGQPELPELPEQISHHDGHSDDPLEAAVYKSSRHNHSKETFKPTIHKNMSSYFGYSGERLDVHDSNYNYLEESFGPDAYTHDNYRYSDEVTATYVDSQGYDQFEMKNNNSRSHLVDKTY